MYQEGKERCIRNAYEQGYVRKRREDVLGTPVNRVRT
jgi:hypothetical protein